MNCFFFCVCWFYGVSLCILIGYGVDGIRDGEFFLIIGDEVCIIKFILVFDIIGVMNFVKNMMEFVSKIMFIFFSLFYFVLWCLFEIFFKIIL